MPVLIILMMYIHDLALMKRWSDQMDFVALQMVSMIQNISQKRANKTITANDIRYTVSAAYLTVFPEMTRFQTGHATSVLGYNPLGKIFYVKGNDNGTASVMWQRRYHIAGGGMYKPTDISVDTYDDLRCVVNSLQNVAASKIYPTLKINPGEVKIIVECAIHYSQSGYRFTDGRSTGNVAPAKAFGFNLLPLDKTNYSSLGRKQAQGIYFNSVVIFSPKPGLFSETAPT